jgi:phage shock protein C
MEPKRLYRSGKDKIIAGVCGGIAEYFEVDPVWVRLIVTLITFVTGGVGLLIYVIAWIIVPVNPAHRKTTDTEAEKVAKKITEKVESVQEQRKIGRGRLLAGALLIILGTGLLFQNIFGWFGWEYIWPAMIIAVGIFILMRRKDER